MPCRPSSPSFGHRSRGKQVAAIDLLGARRQFCSRERAHRLAQQVDVFAEAEVEVGHGCSPGACQVAGRGILSDNRTDSSIWRTRRDVALPPRRPVRAAVPGSPPTGGFVGDRAEDPAPQPVARATCSPTETELARSSRVNRSTVREALRRLESRASSGATAAASACSSRGPDAGRNRVARRPRAGAGRRHLHRAVGSNAGRCAADRRACRRTRRAEGLARLRTRSRRRRVGARRRSRRGAASWNSSARWRKRAATAC